DRVHPDRLVVVGTSERHHRADGLEQDEGHREGVDGRDERGERLVPELPDVAVEPAVRDAVPGLLRDEADEEDPEEARRAVGGEPGGASPARGAPTGVGGRYAIR